jgi:hypothetical protein
MRPITPQPLCPIIVRCEAGGYRAWAVIGAILIGLSVIGLAGAMVIRPLEVSNNSENITGLDGTWNGSTEISENNENYYQGFLGLYRKGHSYMPRTVSRTGPKDGI